MKTLVLGLILMMGSVVFAQDAMMQMNGKAMETLKAKASEMSLACKQDSVQFCKEMKGMEKAKTCLKDNYEKLSPGCKEAVGKK